MSISRRNHLDLDAIAMQKLRPLTPEWSSICATLIAEMQAKIEAAMRISDDTALYDITATVRRETQKAWMLDDGSGTPQWVPKSQVEKNDDGTFTMPLWLAKEKGFI
jgi:hypothetical protein